MPDIAALLQQHTAYGWLLLPSAIALGALHGLEPGHSKTMMAAFIIAVRGTVAQAVMLGVAATVSHTAVVWLVAMGGMALGGRIDMEANEATFRLASAVVMILVGVWMGLRTWRHRQSHRHGDHTLHRHQDEHELAHATEIRERFSGREVTTGQIILFGLTGGLIPCPAAITVLLLCLQLKKIALGALLVLGFSVGLALTLVSFGVVAAVGVRHISRRWHGLEGLAQKAPYISAVVIIAVGCFVGASALAAFR